MPTKNPLYGGVDFSPEESQNIAAESAIMAVQRTATTDEKLVIAALIPEIIKALRSGAKHIAIVELQSANAGNPQPANERPEERQNKEHS